MSRENKHVHVLCCAVHIKRGSQPDKTRCGDLPDARTPAGRLSVEKKTPRPRRVSALDDSETGAGMRWGRGLALGIWDRIGKQVAAERKRSSKKLHGTAERKGATQNVKWWGGQMISGGATASAGPDWPTSRTAMQRL